MSDEETWNPSSCIRSTNSAKITSVSIQNHLNPNRVLSPSLCPLRFPPLSTVQRLGAPCSSILRKKNESKKKRTPYRVGLTGELIVADKDFIVKVIHSYHIEMSGAK